MCEQRAKERERGREKSVGEKEICESKTKKQNNIHKKGENGDHTASTFM